MKDAPIPENEVFRLKALKEYSILDTLPEEEYDDITQLASQICKTPISLISIIDEKRQWFKSKVGLGAEETSRKDSFCAHAIIEPDKIFTVKDSTKDIRFYDNPLVVGEPHVIFYTGVPLVSPSGMPLGTLCVIDDKPNELDEVQLKSLQALSNQVVSLFELRKSKMLLEKFSKDLETRNVELEKFAHVAAHDIKSPLSNISVLSEILMSDYSANLNDDAIMLLKMMNTSSTVLRNLVDGILEHSKTDFILNEKLQIVNLEEVILEIENLLDTKQQYEFIHLFENQDVLTNKVALQQILINLITNSIKYNDKEKVKISIGFSENEEHYNFFIADNGLGIQKEKQDKIFNIFEVLNNEDRFGNKGNGIGLSTVKKLVQGLGGKITVDSEMNKGARFSFSLSKSNFI